MPTVSHTADGSGRTQGPSYSTLGQKVDQILFGTRCCWLQLQGVGPSHHMEDPDDNPTHHLCVKKLLPCHVQRGAAPAVDVPWGAFSVGCRHYGYGA
jgi:hypothetical protein